MIHAAMREILRCGDLASDLGDAVRFTGEDPVFPTQYRVGTAGAAALGALAVAMANLRERQTGRRPDVAIDVRDAAASLRGSRYVRIDGKQERSPEAVTGFYRVADGRWNYFHCNAPVHQRKLLEVLGVPAERSRVAAAALGWNTYDLEEAVDVAGGCAPAVRTPEEWRALPNTAALAAEPLVDIRKIGDSAPIALPAGGRPLSGIRILDLTRVLAGPTSGRLLAEYGADVLKITSEQYPDYPALELDTGYGKRKATLDIASSPGRERFESVVRQCDVFSQAYRQDAMVGLGFAPEQVAARRPGIVYVSLNAYGFTGPWRGRRGFDTVVQSASGMAHVSGRGKEPQLMPVSSLDYLAGYLMTFGALVALHRRAEQGGSYCVKISLARASEWLTGLGLMDPAVLDSTPEELGAHELARLLINVTTPRGRLTRLRPVIRFSEAMLNELPEWRIAAESGAVWSSNRP